MLGQHFARAGLISFVPRLCAVLALASTLSAQEVSGVAPSASASTEGAASQATVAAVQFFETEVRPILVEHCIKCHGDSRQEGSLRLDSREAMMLGGDSGAAVASDDWANSAILAAVRYEDYEMPPSGQLSARKIEVLEQWIASGAPWPLEEGAGGLALREDRGITEADREYWAFQPLAQPAVPLPTSETRVDRILSDVDAFVLHELEQAGLGFAEPASPEVLMRRVYFDLVGVPPTRSEARRFLDNREPDAYAKLVDELLEDPRYGQRWGRHWLDLVRYAESDGYNLDSDRPTAYIYRDWVVNALNDDMPYDQFVAAQLAGDELSPSDPQMLAATGYLRNWIYEYNQRDVQTQWDNVLNDITDVTGEVFLGLGMGCARCHDHKFDPILQKDYYRLRASFAAFLPRDDRLYATPEALSTYHQALAEWEAQTETIREQLHELEEPLRAQAASLALNRFPPDVQPALHKSFEEQDGYERQLADFAQRQIQVEWDRLDPAKKLKDEQRERWVALQAELTEFEGLKPQAPPRLLTAGEVATVPPPMLIPRSSTPEPILPASLEVLGGKTLLGDQELKWLAEIDDAADRSPAEAIKFPATSGRRTALADWINSPDNPLPHRVIVNRVWQYHFGSGLVPNASDFGRLGQPPTHPELLDWMVGWFLEHGRSLKQLHRLIVTSSVYMQASQRPEAEMVAANAIDPDNKLLWRYTGHRLDAEQIRDAMLVAADALENRAAGPSAAHDSFARSIFTQIKRNRPHPLLTTFDAPDGSGSVGKRQVTTTPNQSLLLTNAEWPLKVADHMAASLLEKASHPRDHVVAAYERSFQRSPSLPELEQAIRFMRTVTDDLAALSQLDTTNETSGNDQPQVGQGEAALEDAAASAAADSENAGLAAAETVLDPPMWFQTPSYQVALRDLCHVLFNSSEFLYVE